MPRSLIIPIAILIIMAGCATRSEVTPTRLVDDRALPDSVAYTDGSLLSGLAYGEPAFPGGAPMRKRTWTTDSRKFSFTIVGDRTGGGRENWQIFDEAIREINLLRPDFGIMVGDLIWGYHADTVRADEEWQLFRQHADKIDVPFFFLPGNHDVTSRELEAVWQRRLGRLYYSFDYLGCHFLVLNTEQERFSGVWDFGVEQMEFVIGDIERSRNARHTFLLMHKPAWRESMYGQDWQRIEEALGTRPYTVFAGHKHNATYEMRNGRRHIVVGPTGGGLRSSSVPEMGAFHHYTWVTVDGDSAYVGFIRPGGNMLPQDISTVAFMRAARGLVRTEVFSTELTDDGAILPSIEVILENDLPESVGVSFRLTGIADELDGWGLTDGSDSARVQLAPGGKRVFPVSFHTSVAGLNAAPRIEVATDYGGERLYDYSWPVPAFSGSAMKSPDSWLVIGPLTYVDDNDRDRFSLSEQPEYTGLLNADGTVSRDAILAHTSSDTMSWDVLEASDGVLGLSAHFRTTADAMAYGAVVVTSSAEQTVWVEIESDDYSRLILNGVAIEGGRSFDDTTLLPLNLRAGENTVIVESVNTGSGWSFRLRFVDPGNDLQFSTPQ